jgi:hypothetical protein
MTLAGIMQCCATGIVAQVFAHVIVHLLIDFPVGDADQPIACVTSALIRASTSEVSSFSA